jgi:hypothetical protein
MKALKDKAEIPEIKELLPPDGLQSLAAISPCLGLQPAACPGELDFHPMIS